MLSGTVSPMSCGELRLGRVRQLGGGAARPAAPVRRGADHPVRVRADVALLRRLPSLVERHPCLATMMAVEPVCTAAVQDSPLCAPRVPRDRADCELGLDDGPEGDHGRRGAGQRQHLAWGKVSGAAQLGQSGARQRRGVAVAAAILPRAARNVERAGAVPRVQVRRIG